MMTNSKVDILFVALELQDYVTPRHKKEIPEIFKDDVMPLRVWNDNFVAPPMGCRWDVCRVAWPGIGKMHKLADKMWAHSIYGMFVIIPGTEGKSGRLDRWTITKDKVKYKRLGRFEDWRKLPEEGESSNAKDCIC